MKLENFKIAVLQFAPDFLSIERNLSKIGEMCSSLDVDLLVLPELATCGYAFAKKDELYSVAEDGETGRSAEFFSKLSLELDASIFYGFAEREGDKVYNSSKFVNPDGSSTIYRKMHLFGAEKLWFDKSESGFCVVEGKYGVKIGLMICFDWYFPEVARTLALKGAKILCQSANLVMPWCQQAMITRSLENRCVSVTANRVGDEQNGEYAYHFTGGSQVVNHLGERLGQLSENEENILQVCVDMTKVTSQLNKNNDIFQDRRTDFYFR